MAGDQTGPYRIPVISTAEVVCAEPGRIKMNGAEFFFFAGLIWWLMSFNGSVFDSLVVRITAWLGATISGFRQK